MFNFFLVQDVVSNHGEREEEKNAKGRIRDGYTQKP